LKVPPTQQQEPTAPAGRGSGDPAVQDLPADQDSIQRSWWRDRRVTIAGSYVAVVTGTAWLYGVIPFSGRTFPLAPFASVAGWVDCLGDGLTTCTYVGYPKGVDLSLSAALIHPTYQLTRLGMSVEVALNVLSLLAISIGIAALWALAASIARSAAAGAVAAALYYLSPIVVSHTGKTPLWIGFVLLPVPLALAYVALKPDGRPRPLVLACVALTFVAALTLVYLDPYSWAIAAVIGGPLCIAGGAMAVRRTRWRGALVPLLTIGALLVPGLIFRTLEPSAGLSANFPLAFYRAYGADLATTVIPTRDSLVGEVVRSPVERWNPADFYGDGTNLTGAFMGGLTIIAATIGAVWLLRRGRSNRVLIVALVGGGLACLALGLGPSLKLIDKAPAPVADGAVTSSEHLMPASDATISLPWSWIYGVQPFEGMRAAYRWHVGLRLVLAVLAAVAVVGVFRRWRIVGVALVALLMLETTSHGLLDAREQASRNHELVQAFEDDMDRAFGDGRLRESERVLFLPASNDYMIGLIAPHFRVFAYNISFDKELVRLRADQPKPILDAISGYWANTVNRDQLCQLFLQDLLDAVVFNDFDMRWDTLQWPPPAERLEAFRAKSTSFGLFDDPAFSVDKRDVAVIVRPAPGSQAGCGGGR
jgi:hypothetical protein